MRILLVQPDYFALNGGFRLAAMPEPLHLEMVASSCPSHDFRILDMRVDGNLAGILHEFRPDVVGVTALTPEVYAAWDIVREVKACSRDIRTIVGGHHASLLPEDFFRPDVDAIALGEAELVFPRLLCAIESGDSLRGVPNVVYRGDDGRFVRTDRLREKVDLDALPIPRRDLTEAYRNEYFFLFDKPDTSVATGRGCPYRCNFCSVWQFYDGLTSQMSARRVVEELKTIDTDHVTFVDDNFLMNHKRESTIADMIRAEDIRMRFSMECRTDSIARHPELVEKWVDVGLYAVLLGLEGASDSALESVNKKNSAKINDEAIRILKDNGVIIWGAFIVDPAWDRDEFRKLREYVNAKEITHTQFTVLTPLPGTELYRQRFDELLTRDYRCYDTLHSVLPTRLPREEFYKEYAKLYRQTDLGPYFDLVREGKLTIENCRTGKAMLEAMSKWEAFIPGDPVLGDYEPVQHAPIQP